VDRPSPQLEDAGSLIQSLSAAPGSARRSPSDKSLT
jgi:hypothetical protein